MARKSQEFTVKRYILDTSTNIINPIEDVTEEKQEEAFNKMYLIFLNTILAKEGYKVELKEVSAG